jgi:DNA mismatch repair ATPase MutS
LEITDLYHPLIENCVANSLSAKYNEGVLITGSNMSGKTTFIRSIAVNTLLAQTLYTSTSRCYQAPLLDICSSINMADSLDESKSYFQAEALSIFNILNHVKATGGNCLIIIDEIFRGTNTIERVAAARAILSYLSANKNFVFVSTHDLELAELLGDEYAVYSFEEMAADERLIFDYKIKPGILKHKNAIAVLKAIGYPESIIANATKVSDELGKKYSS